jgi:predicted small metal-binding protein
MIRKFIDCRDVVGVKCTVAIFADSEEELLAAAIEHAIHSHGCLDSPELRGYLRGLFKIERRRAICGEQPATAQRRSSYR